MPDERENVSSAAPVQPGGNGGNATELEQEVARLRAQLAEATAEAERYRRAAYALLNERVPYTPPSEEELHDMLHGPRGRPLSELIDELEREGEG
jgi:hypothetical protein